MKDKIIFTQSVSEQKQAHFQPKKEFSNNAEITPDTTEQESNTEALEGELLTEQFEQAVNPKSRWWKPVAWGAVTLFLGGTVAQSIQWLIDSWQGKQWIYFSFAIAGCIVIALGISALIKELWHLRHLRQHLLLQAQSAAIFRDISSPEQSIATCKKMADSLNLDNQHPNLLQWQRQIHDGHSGQEIAYLFSQNVMKPMDKQAKTLITKAAIESATVVAISPLAVVDLFFVAWRHIRLVNRIAKLYGIKLGYFSRLRLMKLVLLNMAFAGATELLHDVGMDWISQDITAKLSARVAQGLGVGLLTARLGIKAMAFCRPLAFQPDEKPRLRHIQKELLSVLKNTVLNPMKVKETEKL
ncbi:TIGR01620 family protein [Actinobacillus porcinus]|uniref:TIGR01620 family protein n=1 Tax=Actinobacillus porcinus TaxID=51048 RepID=UPI0023F23F78|nr:TIGR01620 family protein [Actinobacillus porcinus]MDD7544231.1 TIGR01620 family protein [Actinobacillus porcinus]MDY5847246.1 TIGR01620 family protein [Actinobacillus porcinus]